MDTVLLLNYTIDREVGRKSGKAQKQLLSQKYIMPSGYISVSEDTHGGRKNQKALRN
jgi:hypothetical protein